MGKIWAFIIAIASVYALINGRAEQLLDGILSIPEEAFSFLLIVLSSTIFWTGFMYIFKEVGIIDFISLAIKPLFKKIMPNLKDKEAIRSNMLLILSSERETLFGDPYYGSELKKQIFEQSSAIVTDLLIDELYTTIKTFMPQVILSRKDISVFVANTTLYAEIKYYYVIDNTSDLFTIRLTDSADED